MKKQKRTSFFAIVILILLGFHGVIFSQSETLDKNSKRIIPPKNSLTQPLHKNSNPIFFNRLDLYKKTEISFLPDVQVNSDSGNMFDDHEPVVAVSKEGIIYVAWKGADTLKSIFFSRSLDGGKTFLPAIRINDSVDYPPSYSVFQPDIALDAEGNIYIVWFDYRAWADDNSYTSPVDVYIDKSTDNGVTWGSDVKVSVGGSGTYPWHYMPYIAIDQKTNYIYVTFIDYDRYYPVGDHSDISVGRSIDGALSFENKVRVDDCPDTLLAEQSIPSIAVDSVSGYVYVTFQDTRNGGKDIYFTKSTDYGLSFGENIIVNKDTTNEQVEASVKTDKSGAIYVVYNEWSVDSTFQDTTVYMNDIYMAKSTNEGDSFFESVKINKYSLGDAYGYNFLPRLAIDDSNVVNVVWYDHHKGYNTCNYSQSSDGGQTFSDAIMINDEMDSVNSALPRIAVDNNKGIYVVWMDKRNGNDKYDIFFSRNDNLTAVNNENHRSDKFSLSQNYPNPFNPSTNIKYQIPKSGHVTLKIYDILGKEVISLINKEQPAGSYEITFNASNLTSGIYFYRLTTNNFTEIKRMALIK